MNDYEELMEKIRDIFLDYRTIVHAEETDDGSGKRYVDYELECVREQERDVISLIQHCFHRWARELSNKIWAKSE
jgi:hypothetical protein